MSDVWYVYVIQSQVKRFRYTGMSTDIQQRLKEHNSGKVRSTKAFTPYNILYSEKIGTRNEARKREKYLKSYRGRQYVKNLFDSPPE